MALLPKRVMNFAYGMGAAVVIVGALFKIQHWAGASIMLIVGLGVEALIFGLSAFDEPDKDWVVEIERHSFLFPSRAMHPPSSLALTQRQFRSPQFLRMAAHYSG